MIDNIGDFDEFADGYESSLTSALGMFGGENSYFTTRKVEIIAQIAVNQNHFRILDYGCGIGLLTGILREQFPEAEIWGSDISATSMKIAKMNNPTMVEANDDELPLGHFDYVVLSNVLHHVSSGSRNNLLVKISKTLNEKGKLIIFEHNKLNPVTRKIVDRCEFDVGVELLSKSSCTRMFDDSGNFEVIDSGYFLVFPPILKKLRHLESFFNKLPVGAQFWLLAELSDSH